MRRIYESTALVRDDDPHSPAQRSRETQPEAIRSIDGSGWSRRLLPARIRHRAISVDIATPRTEFHPGETVPFRVTMTNALPVPVTIPTESAVPWTWHVDGFTEASELSGSHPAERRGFQFGRSERKRFTRHWHGSFRVSESEWEPADPGRYTIGVQLSVPDAAGKGLAAETTVRIVEE